jgi:hypothetical protein
MAGRWPVHPLPLAGEALSSWLDRLALVYGYTAEDILRFDLGVGAMTSEDLDLDPPAVVMAGLSERTGVPVDRVRAMTVPGWIPLMIDGPAAADTFATYVCGHEVLFPAALRPVPDLPGSWRPWLDRKRFAARFGCPCCAQEDAVPYWRLAWRLPWMSSCPRHGVRLQPVCIWPGQPFRSPEDHALAVAPPEIVALDRLTWQAVENGVADLPHRQVHGGVWLRLLRALLDELSVAAKILGSYRRMVDPIWQVQGLGFRQGFSSRWQPFEEMTAERQASLLHLAAIAVGMLRDGRIEAAGAHARLFQPLPFSDRDLPSTAPLRPLITPQPSPVWPSWPAGRQLSSIVEATRKAIAAAQEDPVQAAVLYRFLLSVRRTPGHKANIDRTFLDLGIPIPEEAAPPAVT